MKKKKFFISFQKIKITLAFIVAISCLFSFANISSAQSKKDLGTSLNFIPQITIPGSEFIKGASTSVGQLDEETGKMESDLLARYIIAVFNYALAIVAILATIVLMGAGIIWLTSGGDSGKVSKAKQLIAGSITGMIILACSWIILNTINPELTKLQVISMEVTEPVVLGYLNCCNPGNGLIKIPYKEENGKKIITQGENTGKEAVCPTTSPECLNENVCVKYGKVELFSCSPNKICCQCSFNSWEKLQTKTIYRCVRTPVSVEECKEICNKEDNWLRGTIYYEGFNAETHACDATFTGQCKIK